MGVLKKQAELPLSRASQTRTAQNGLAVAGEEGREWGFDPVPWMD